MAAKTNIKSTLLGNNRLNFRIWLLIEILINFTSLVLVAAAIYIGKPLSAEQCLLLAIYLVLIGHFGLALQEYCAKNFRDADKK